MSQEKYGPLLFNTYGGEFMSDKLKGFYKTTWGKVCLVLMMIAGCFIVYASYIKHAPKNINHCLKSFQSQAFEKAYHSCSSLADKGDVRAKLIIGNMYENGYYVQKDYERAEILYKEIADNPSKPEAHKIAHFALAELYFRKDFSKHNPETAVKWLKLAADQGVNHAQLKYGISLFAGHGVERNVNLAKEYVMKASQNGLKEQAQQMLLLMNSPDADEAAKLIHNEINGKNE